MSHSESVVALGPDGLAEAADLLLHQPQTTGLVVLRGAGLHIVDQLAAAQDSDDQRPFIATIPGIREADDIARAWLEQESGIADGYRMAGMLSEEAHLLAIRRHGGGIPWHVDFPASNELVGEEGPLTMSLRFDDEDLVRTFFAKNYHNLRLLSATGSNNHVASNLYDTELDNLPNNADETLGIHAVTQNRGDIVVFRNLPHVTAHAVVESGGRLLTQALVFGQALVRKYELFANTV